LAKINTKGAVIDQDISGTLTPVAQIISFSHSGAEAETFDATTIDTSGAGKEHQITGYSEGGTLDFELYYDSELAGHKALTSDITTPAERGYSITLAGGTEMTFTAAGISFGFSGDMGDGIKGDVSLKLDQLLTYTV
jgi:hypothetical protein